MISNLYQSYSSFTFSEFCFPAELLNTAQIKLRVSKASPIVSLIDSSAGGEQGRVEQEVTPVGTGSGCVCQSSVPGRPNRKQEITGETMVPDL